MLIAAAIDRLRTIAVRDRIGVGGVAGRRHRDEDAVPERRRAARRTDLDHPERDRARHRRDCADPAMPRPLASLLLVAAVIAEMWPLTIGWNSAFPIDTFYPRTPLIDAVLRHHRPGFDRVAGIGNVLFPNTNAMFGIEDARIHDPMEPARYVHFIGGAITHDYYKKWIDDRRRCSTG